MTAYQTSYSVWLWLSIGYAVLYMPTQALTNSLAMTHLADPKRQFLHEIKIESTWTRRLHVSTLLG